MSAELVDPFAPIHEPLLTHEEYAAIQADVKDSPWLDPTRFQECLDVAMDALRTIACVTVSTPPEVTATQALRRIVQRAVSGVPFIEHYEPADSFDPAPRVDDRIPRDGWTGHRDLCALQWGKPCDCEGGDE
jgi:hypothetical protein